MIAVLLKHRAGRLPVPLAPEEIAIRPLSIGQGAYAGDIASMLRCAEWCVRLIPPTETLSRRIVEARELRIPMLAVVGRRETGGEGWHRRAPHWGWCPDRRPAGDLASRIAASASADVGVASVREVA